MRSAPRLYTIAPDRPFLGTLAAGLLAEASGDPLRLARMQVLLPTRRAVRALREAFLRTARAEAAPGAPLLLPRLRAVGEIDGDELEFAPEPGADDTLALPPAMPELRRRLLLARLVLEWSAERRGDGLPPGQAASLATALGRLLDTVASEGARLTGLAELVPGELALHWQTVLAFLEILPKRWPEVLAAEGAIDAADRRNRLLRRQAQEWRLQPPADPVIAAGLTGGMPALAELLGVVLDLRQGAVILPGLDRSCDAADREAIIADEAHPQHVMARLLDGFGIAADEVSNWPARRHLVGAAAGERDRPNSPSPPPAGEEANAALLGALASARSRRLHLVAQALRPAALTHRWRELPREDARALAGLNRYECASPQDEAVTIALLLRRKLATPGATAALVTPDRELARRVAAELRRWHIEIDDSAGLPLTHTPPGVFLRLVVELADSRFAPVPLLAALKHPLSAGGLAPEAFRERTRRLERAIRGPRPAPGLAGLRAVLGRDRDGLAPFVERLAASLGPFPDLLESPSVTLAEIATQHVAAAERLAASAEETGTERLWRESAGEAAARFCHELIEAARDLPEIPGRHYPALFEALAAGAVVRPVFGRHPRLAIWGLLEARLQQADLVVLGGLNEDTWPGPASYDPWMSRPMRRELGIAVPERAIGLAAHDFAQAIGAPEVALTRAARREGAPTVPSRWLLRLDTVLRAVGLADRLGPDPEILGAAAALDEPSRYRPLPQAAPRPPLAARPRRLSVTQIETWLRDPYAIYARHILGLRALEDLDADPGRAELGTLVHQALDAFVARFPRTLPDGALADLAEIGQQSFGPSLSRPGVWAFWWPRFLRIAQWFVAEERRYRASLAESRSELSGSLTLAAPGGPFIVTGKADRIDRLAAGGLVLADYKTGALPTVKEIEAGLALQLPLEGAILRDGSFAGLSGAPASLEYWRLGGGEPAGERKRVGGADPGVLVDRVLARVAALVARFDDPATPYLSTPAPLWAPRFSDYRHLERLGDGEAEE